MKKVLLVMLCVLLLAGTATANNVRKDCGCGLGGMALGDKEGLGWKLLGTFLNGLCANQTFAMSSGTSDCGPFDKFAMNERFKVFVADNMDALAVDIASGQGETLIALAEITQIPNEKQGLLFAELQHNFERIYPTANVTHYEVAKEISEIIKTI